MAGSTGLEPAASGVTGRRYNRLNYDPETLLFFLGVDRILQGLASFKLGRDRCSNRDFFSGLGILPLPGGTLGNVERAKSNQSQLVSLLQTSGYPIDYSLNRFFRSNFR